jgi:hypothetical protein
VFADLNFDDLYSGRHDNPGKALRYRMCPDGIKQRRGEADRNCAVDVEGPRNSCSILCEIGAPVVSSPGLDQMKPCCDRNGLDKADGAQFITRNVKI